MQTHTHTHASVHTKQCLRKESNGLYECFKQSRKIYLHTFCTDRLSESCELKNSKQAKGQIISITKGLCSKQDCCGVQNAFCRILVCLFDSQNSISVSLTAPTLFQSVQIHSLYTALHKINKFLNKYLLHLPCARLQVCRTGLILDSGPGGLGGLCGSYCVSSTQESQFSEAPANG